MAKRSPRLPHDAASPALKPQTPRNKRALIEENARLRAELHDARQTLNALRSGEVDAIVVDGIAGERIFTLQTAERPYRTIVEEMHEGAATLSPDGTVLYCNRRFAEILKTSIGRILGHPLQSFVAPDDHGMLQALIWQSESVSAHGEIAFRARDGSRVPAYVGANHLAIDNMNAVCLVVMDMTEQRRNEHALRLLQAMAMSIGHASDFESALRLVLRTVCHATNWIVGEAWLPLADGGGLKCSPAWYTTRDNIEAFRRDVDDLICLPGIGLIGQVWTSQKPAWARDVTLDPHFRSIPIAKELGLKAGVVIPVLARDEVVAILAFYMSETRAEDERMVSLISAVAAQLGPIIERKQAEDANALLASIVETADEAIVSTGLDAIIRGWNGMAQRRFGYNLNDTRGRNLSMLFPPDRRADIERILRDIRRGMRLHHLESVIVCKDEVTVPVFINAVPLPDSRGNITGLALHISEHKTAPLLMLHTRSQP